MNKYTKFSFLASILLSINVPLVASESYYVSSHGYFIGDSEHVTDWKLADAIVDFLRKEKAETLVDFGCGDGDYVNHFIKNGIYAVGYDGNPVTEDASGGTCFVLDLSSPVDVQKHYDWVMSLEVGEHLPKQYETIFIENLVRHVKNGLILSWAVKGQGGTGHFNEQNNDYIKHIFANMGWYNDLEAENHLRELAAVHWFKNTVMVFRPSKP
ncbi:MAG: Aureococcus anophagefferens virus [Chlamydiota bacterium]|jgi:cyclopropane fatty-acyl-phospholipid synthase-like methyltransferase